MTPNEVMMNALRYALSIRRPHGTDGDGRLVTYLVRLVASLHPNLDTWLDEVGNLHVDLRTTGLHRTLFVAHVDTVHRTPGPNVIVEKGHMWCAVEGSGKPLGADDGAGVAVLCGLIASNVPAYYIFTRGEECGGVGSRYLAENMPDLLAEFDRAIAVDRRDVISVITHQAGGRCCSDTFGGALADELNSLGMLMMTDDGGVYTDTAEFVDIIPECTNISAGYYGEHSDRECLDVEFLQQLFKAMVEVRWDDLPVERDPLEDDYSYLAPFMRSYVKAELEALDMEDFDDVASDPFAWSDGDGVVQTGSGRKH